MKIESEADALELFEKDGWDLLSVPKELWLRASAHAA